MLRALVPISVDSPHFRTAIVVPALKAIAREHDEVFFLIADRLQVYNKARELAKGDLAIFLERFDRLSRDYFEQRVAWLERLRRSLRREGVRCENWRIIGIQHVTDASFYSIFRNVFLATQTIVSLARDVREAMGERIGPGEKNGAALRLCEAYLIEEIAINIRLRVYEEIQSEFYLGETIAPLLGLYEGVYGIDVFSIARRPRVAVEFSFFRPARGSSDSFWVPVHYQERRQSCRLA